MSFNLLSIMDGAKALTGGEIAYVCLMGVGIVFAGLVCIVLLCTIMSAIMKHAVKEPVAQAPQAPVEQANAEPIANKQEFVAAVSAAIAENLGTDVSAIRIKSIKRI